MIRTWEHNCSGQISVIFAICFFALVSLVGAAITLSMDSRAASELQHTADS
ncbi:MAG: pilus assembly protein TadG-related protein [Pseudomonadota bacterium]